MRKLSISTSNNFNAIHSCSVRQSQKLQKTLKLLYSEGSRLFKIIDVDTTKKLVTSACYDKQHGCAYLQQLLIDLRVVKA